MGRDILKAFFLPILVASITDEDAGALGIDDGVVSNETIGGGLVMAALVLSHAVKQADAGPATVNDEVVFYGMVLAGKSDAAVAVVKLVGFDEAVFAAAHDQFAFAIMEFITPENITRTFVADDFAFAIAADKCIVFNDCAGHDVAPCGLILAEFHGFTSVVVEWWDILKKIIRDDVICWNAEFFDSVVDLDLHTAAGDVDEAAAGDCVLIGACGNENHGPSASAMLERAIGQRAMLGLIK